MVDEFVDFFWSKRGISICRKLQEAPGFYCKVVDVAKTMNDLVRKVLQSTPHFNPLIIDRTTELVSKTADVISHMPNAERSDAAMV